MSDSTVGLPLVNIGHTYGMEVAGTETPAGVAARLALRLHQAGELGLAHRVGLAVDTGHDVAFNDLDRMTVLRVLADWPGEMTEIRNALR